MERNRKTRIWIPALVAGAAAGLGAYWLIHRRQDPQPQRLPGLPGWQPALEKQFGVEKAGKLMGVVEVNYTALLHKHAMPSNQALQDHLKKHIFPGLALYQALLAEFGGDREAALAEIDFVFRAWTVAQFRGLATLTRVFPTPFWLFKFLSGLRMRDFPSEGWDFQDVESSDTRIAFNATRCFYLDTLTSLGAPELTASFCKIDEVMAESFPSTIRFVRPHTLGRGDPQCDFQYCYQARPHLDLIEGTA